MNLYLVLNNQSLSNLNQIYVPITFIEGIKILSFSLFYGLLIRSLFIKFSNSLSSKQGLGNTILLVMISTSSLIAVLKSSLALSLGLVGALSVIRFRSAIKEPYNLAFILFAISISIALGASQFSFATLIIVFGSIAVFYLFKFRKGSINKKSIEGLDTITLNLTNNLDLVKVYSLLDKHLIHYKIQSFMEDKNNISFTLRTSINDLSKLEIFRKELKLICDDFELNFFDSPNI